MLDEVEVGRHYKGFGCSTTRLALVTTGICLSLGFTSKLRSTLVPQSVWVLSFSNVFSLRVGCEPVHSLERIFKMPKKYKIQYTIIKVLSLPHMQQMMWYRMKPLTGV
jgi:hypothetical protein